MTMKLHLIIFICILTGFLAGPVMSQDAVQWTSLDSLPKLVEKEPRPILIFIHTDWCKVCAMQEKTTFHDEQVIKKLNQAFYAVKLNAETKEDLQFANRTYHYKSTGNDTGIHELAEILAIRMGMVSYPTTVILSPQFELREKLIGLQSAQDILDVTLE